ncbi:glycoside hydrolase family 15 protein [Ornithinimicrobium sp. F0845]|uniref:glycoside hydrolase family 15 protein n=1 Tax=Ornithinimicrobium sp. F0845 TaxID=2926412 RepID=UPI001FF6C6A4|nr:glycoside hydrolase family 15 protein [Ornithinimicrobium sp. F0845]MCK0114104.1 glycoside hydrolase family 15 protein [Ornithinimicrobium sp. F0845]
MSTPLEDYALLSDLRTGPLVSREGSVDWLCLPRFDSQAVFSALLGGPDDGRWQLSIADGTVESWGYEPSTFVLETVWRSPTGRARVLDFLPPADTQGDLVRIVECLEGRVEVVHDLRIRFNYARATPWVRRLEDTADGRERLSSLAGPDGLLLTGPPLHAAQELTEGTSGAGRAAPDDDEGSPDTRDGGRAHRLVGSRMLSEGEETAWDLTWYPSWEEQPEGVDAREALERTRRFWTEWADQIEAEGLHALAITRSLLTLRAMTHAQTGGIVAAPTASLPEEFGGSRNWDYRYTWLRDASLTIEVMVDHGFTQGALLWRDWLLRAVAGDIDDLRIMYGLGGERELDEKELDHLSGYEDSRPVRIGNGAAGQYQADVPGEVMLALARLRDAEGSEDGYSWGLQRNLLRYCEANLSRKDHGLWEMRGDLHHFTHGRVMMWAAFNEGVRAVEEHGLAGDVEHWRTLRDQLRTEILEQGYDQGRGTFTQTYDNDEVDASLLQLPHTGFVAYDDELMLGTVAAIEEDLQGPTGLLHRYRTAAGLDGLEGAEYPFLMCCFWLVEQYAMSGRMDEARSLMTQLLDYSSGVGLLSEEYDPETGRLAGNYPQAFSHLSLIRAADALAS